MIDLQNEKDERGIALSCAGVKNYKHPINIEIDDKPQAVIANFSCSTQLLPSQRGAHMSRFVELFSSSIENLSYLSLQNISTWHKNLLQSQGAQRGTFEVQCSIFLEKKAPVSQKVSLMNYDIELKTLGSIDNPDIQVTLKVPCTSCCPCSKAISQFGAHNQRTIVSVSFYLQSVHAQISLAQLIRDIEKSASSDLFALIKREDEKFVTEKPTLTPNSQKISLAILLQTSQNISILSKMLIFT